MICPICLTESSSTATYECTHAVCTECAVKMIYVVRDSACCVCKRVSGRIVMAGSRRGRLHVYTDRRVQSRDDQMTGRTAQPVQPTDRTAQSVQPTNRTAQSVRLVQPTNSAVQPVVLCDGRARDIANRLLAYTCKQCMHTLPSLTALHAHYTTHSLLLCHVCTSSEHLLPAEYVLHTRTSLPAHMRTHSQCSFCHTHFYSARDAHLHCIRTHAVCSVCDGAGHRHRFYRDARALAVHMRVHYACMHCSDVYFYMSEVIVHCRDVHGEVVRMCGTREKDSMAYYDPYAGTGSSTGSSTGTDNSTGSGTDRRSRIINDRMSSTDRQVDVVRDRRSVRDKQMKDRDRRNASRDSTNVRVDSTVSRDRQMISRNSTNERDSTSVRTDNHTGHVPEYLDVGILRKEKDRHGHRHGHALDSTTVRDRQTKETEIKKEVKEVKKEVREVKKEVKEVKKEVKEAGRRFIVLCVRENRHKQ